MTGSRAASRGRRAGLAGRGRGAEEGGADAMRVAPSSTATSKSAVMPHRQPGQAEPAASSAARRKAGRVASVVAGAGMTSGPRPPGRRRRGSLQEGARPAGGPRGRPRGRRPRPGRGRGRWCRRPAPPAQGPGPGQRVERVDQRPGADQHAGLVALERPTKCQRTPRHLAALPPGPWRSSRRRRPPRRPARPTASAGTAWPPPPGSTPPGRAGPPGRPPPPAP